MISTKRAHRVAVPDIFKLHGITEIADLGIGDHAARDDPHVRGHVGSFERPRAKRLRRGRIVFFVEAPKRDLDAKLFAQSHQAASGCGVKPLLRVDLIVDLPPRFLTPIDQVQ